MWVVGCAQAATLEEAIQSAEAHSRELALVRESTRATESLRGQAWSALAPKVQATARYTINNTEIALDPTAGIPPEFAALLGESEPIVVQQKEYADWNVSVIQPLFSGQSLPGLRGAYALTAAAREDERTQSLLIREGVTRAYYGVLTTREGETLAAEAVSTNRDALALARKMVEAGLAPPRTGLQAELALSAAERDARNATAARIQAEMAFARLTGLPPDSSVALPAAPSLPAERDQTLDRRPDVVAAEHRARAARFQHQANWLGWTPEVDARFTYAWSENTGFAGRNDLWMVVFEANWLLWDGGYRLAKSQETASQVRAAELMAARQREVATEEVAVAWAQVERAQSAVDAVSKEIALAEKNLEQAQASFSAGSLTFLELQSAELQLRSTRLSALLERMNLDLAAISLKRSLGQGS